MRWLRLCGWEEGAAVAEIGSIAENLRDGAAAHDLGKHRHTEGGFTESPS